MRKDASTAYLLLAMSAFGMSGLHRFYLGKPFSGLLWFMTMGLGGVGTLYDLLTMHRQVELHNEGQAMLGAARSLRALPAAPPRESAMPFKTPLELRLLRVAQKRNGRLTVMQAAAELGVHTEEVEAELDKMCHEGHANVEVSEDGVLFYDFPELRFR